jgi:Kef-type K+ transport system membrane component KefB
VGYLVVVLFGYCAIAAFLDISMVFAAFLAGFGIVGGVSGTERERYRDPLEAIAKVSFGMFVPIYFGLVGYKLVFGREFSLTLLVAFFLGSTLLSLTTSGLAARLAGFRGLDIFNIALTLNARGGPGIVLASVAYDAGIISAAFYTTLVLTAVVTSQMAGSWLRYVLHKGLPLLSTNPAERWVPATEAAAEESVAASWK